MFKSYIISRHFTNDRQITITDSEFEITKSYHYNSSSWAYIAECIYSIYLELGLDPIKNLYMWIVFEVSQNNISKLSSMFNKIIGFIERDAHETFSKKNICFETEILPKLKKQHQIYSTYV